MKRFRFSIATMMVFVLVVGFGFAAMRSGSDLCLQAFWTFTASVLLAAAIAARNRGPLKAPSMAARPSEAGSLAAHGSARHDHVLRLAACEASAIESG
jgi:hypothetical protein